MLRLVAVVTLVTGCDLVFAPDTIDVGKRCPGAYRPVPGLASRYRLWTDAHIWDDAVERCIGEQPDGPVYTHLVVLDDDNERFQLDLAFGDNVKWIGLSDRVSEGVFQTVTIQTTDYPPLASPPWALSQPDNGAGGGDQQCVRLLGPPEAQASTLDDDFCGQPQQFICECDLYPPDPTKY